MDCTGLRETTRGFAAARTAAGGGGQVGGVLSRGATKPRAGAGVCDFFFLLKWLQRMDLGPEGLIRERERTRVTP